MTDHNEALLIALLAQRLEIKENEARAVLGEIDALHAAGAVRDSLEVLRCAVGGAWYLGAEAQHDAPSDREATLAVVLADTPPAYRAAVGRAFRLGAEGRSAEEAYEAI